MCDDNVECWMQNDNVSFVSHSKLGLRLLAALKHKKHMRWGRFSLYNRSRTMIYTYALHA